METTNILISELRPGMKLYRDDIIHALEVSSLQQEKLINKDKLKQQLCHIVVVIDQEYDKNGIVTLKFSDIIDSLCFDVKDHIDVIKQYFDTVLNMIPVPARLVTQGEMLYTQRLVELMVYKYGMPEDIILEDFHGRYPEFVQVINVSQSQYDPCTVDIELEGVDELYSFYSDEPLYIYDELGNEDTHTSLIDILQRIAITLESIDKKIK